MRRSLKVTAPSRLHFGLLRFDCSEGRSYGGLGMMIDRPGVEVELSESDRWHAEGPGAERALQLARSAVKALYPGEPPPLRIRVVKTPRFHSGLGSGTQLALAVALGIDRILGSGQTELRDLVSAVGRGQRSAVGSYGFRDGGVIWERGKLPGETLGELTRRVEFPECWSVVLITPAKVEGLSGEVERKAFENLPSVPEKVTHRLIHLAEQQIFPSVEQSDFDVFSDATYEYGALAGNCFASIQGGPFASPQISELIRHVRLLGVKAVGQSSWGPTIFAITQDIAAAETLVAKLQRSTSSGVVRLEIASPNNHGVRIKSLADCLEQTVAYQGFAK